MLNTKLIHDFVANWSACEHTDKKVMYHHGYEKGESQPFWLDLLHALGVEAPAQFISFEQQVHIDHTAFIDGFIPATKVLVEQKSIQKDLGEPIKQSDGSLLNPFQQAKRYAAELPYSSRPRWIVTCNFREFWVYDMEQPNAEPQKILMENLEKEHYRLKFLVDQGSDTLRKEMELSIKAGDLVGKIYDAILPQYANPDSPETLQSLNQLCVRLVFCLFAEDAGLFGDKNEFHDYLAQFPAKNIRHALIDLFKVLDTKLEDRDPYLDEDLKSFPYVNGGLFSNENIEIPQFTDELRDLILSKASEDFDWSEISPTIFGAVFESTLNPDTRRSGGMHYTSIENIHKVIDPLFLNQLRHEFEACKNNRDYKAFQDKLSSLTFFDPACGSGNFLTETYVSLRRLENEVIKKLQGDQMVIGDVANPIKVDIHQFYGIEINDFAVSVATTALWIAELQMMHETEKIASFHVNPLPLKSYHNIHEGNALRMDWISLTPHAPSPEGDGEISTIDYIMGNPPFVGKKEQSKEQKQDVFDIFQGVKGCGVLDYVSCWYKKASTMMTDNPKISAAFVSTNSITQGEQAAILWKELLEKDNLQINFAYPTFRWDSESNLKAHVHCVIIGFTRALTSDNSVARLYLSDGTYKQCKNINGYLVDGPNVFIELRTKPICNVPEMMYGSMPIDDGHLILSKEDVDELLKEDANNSQYIREYAGGAEIIKNEKRWCLWLQNVSPKVLRASAYILNRIQLTKEFRSSSNRPQTLALAETPYLFGEIRQPDTAMIVVPKVSSETRRYIPIAMAEPTTIINGSALLVPQATNYAFGILISNVHQAWMRAVAGRMKSDYQYSASIVYNNFPWPKPTVEQQTKIEQMAQAILDARAMYPECSLADLYDDKVMPVELRRAHQDNDRAVMAAYGFDTKMSESDCVAKLLEMYQELTCVRGYRG